MTDDDQQWDVVGEEQKGKTNGPKLSDTLEVGDKDHLCVLRIRNSGGSVITTNKEQSKRAGCTYKSMKNRDHGTRAGHMGDGAPDAGYLFTE